MRKSVLLTLVVVAGCAATDPAPASRAWIEAPDPRPAFMPAEEPAAGPMRLTVPEAVALSAARNPDLGVAAERIVAAWAGVDEARAAWYPALGLALDYSHTNDQALVFFHRLRQRDLDLTGDPNSPDHRGNVRAAAEARWLVYDGGRRGAAVELAKLAVSMEEGARDAVQNELRAAVIGTALAAFEAEEFIRVSEDSVGLVTEQLKIAKSRHEVGAAQRSDVLMVEVRLAEARERLVRAGNARERALAALTNLLGFEAGEEFALDAGGGFTVPPVETPDLFAAARANRPELRSARDAVRAAEKGLALEQSGHYPKVSAFGTYAFDDENGTFSKNQDSYVLGVRAELAVFEGYLTRTRVSRSRARIREAQAAERKARLAVEQDVTRARLDLSEARERLTVSEKSGEYAEEALALIRARYESGAATITEFLDAEVALTGARVRSVAARFDVERATAELRRALGICRAGEAPGGSR